MKSKGNVVLLVGGYIRRYPSSLASLYGYLSKKSRNFNLKRRILPLIRKFKTKNLKIIALDPTSSEMLARHSIEHDNFKKYSSIEKDKKIQEESVRFLRNLYSKNKLFKQLSDYKDISLWEANELDIWQSFFYKIFKRINIINEIIKRNNPSKVIINSTDTHNKILEQIARKRNIETILRLSSLSKFTDKLYDFLLPFGIALMDTGLNKIACSKKRANIKIRTEPKILFLTTMGLIKAPIRRMLNELNSRRKHVKIISTSGISKINYKKEIDFSNFSAYLTPNIRNNMRTTIKDMKNNFSKLMALLDSRELEYKGVIINGFLKELFYFLYFKRYPESALLIELLKEAIRVEKPNIIMIMDDLHYIGRLISLTARKLGVPTLVVQHGFLLDHALRGLYADYIAVYGNSTKEMYLKRGAKSKNVFVTGNVKFDTFYNKRFDDKKTKRILRIKNNNKTVLFVTATGNLTQHTKLVISSMKNVDANFIIKLHPCDYYSEGYYRSLLKKMRCKGIVIKHFDIFALLHLCDMLIMWESTTGLEAVVFNKPFINLRFGDNFGDYFCVNCRYCEDGVAISASDLRSLRRAITRCLYDNKLNMKLSRNRKKYVKKHLFKLDGKAVLRVNRFVDKIISKKRS